MNTAPLEELDLEAIAWTPEQVREMDQNVRKRGGRNFMLAARHVPTGELVGYTSIIHYAFQTQFLWQDDTAVSPEHRNRGLGRWLKAANLLRVLDACPEATRIRTGNAGSNAPMLNINRAMGFREIFANVVYQIPVENARAYLRERAR